MLRKGIQRRPGADVLPLDKNSVKTGPAGNPTRSGREGSPPLAVVPTNEETKEGEGVGVDCCPSCAGSEVRGSTAVFEKEGLASIDGTGQSILPRPPPIPAMDRPSPHSLLVLSALLRAQGTERADTPLSPIRSALARRRPGTDAGALHSAVRQRPAGVAQLAEHQLPMLKVAGSIPVSRSVHECGMRNWECQTSPPSLHIPQSQLPTRHCPGG
jgi:hypothetical protein